MAVSGKTSPDEIPYCLGTDKPPDMAAATKAIADRMQALLPSGTKTDGRIVVVNSGAAAFKAMSGDATIDKEGALTIGAAKVGTSKLVDKAVTTAKLEDGAATEAKVADKAITSRKAKLTGISAYQSADQILGTSAMSSQSALAGTSKSIELAIESLVLVTAFFCFRLEEISGDQEQCQGTLVVGTTPQTPLALAKFNHVEAEAKRMEVTVGQAYLVAVPAGTTALSLRARIQTVGGGNAGLYVCGKDNTGFTAVAVAGV